MVFPTGEIADPEVLKILEFYWFLEVRLFFPDSELAFISASKAPNISFIYYENKLQHSYKIKTIKHKAKVNPTFHSKQSKILHVPLVFPLNLFFPFNVLCLLFSSPSYGCLLHVTDLWFVDVCDLGELQYIRLYYDFLKSNRLNVCKKF